MSGVMDMDMRDNFRLRSSGRLALESGHPILDLGHAAIEVAGRRPHHDEGSGQVALELGDLGGKCIHLTRQALINSVNFAIEPRKARLNRLQDFQGRAFNVVSHESSLAEFRARRQLASLASDRNIALQGDTHVS